MKNKIKLWLLPCFKSPKSSTVCLCCITFAQFFSWHKIVANLWTPLSSSLLCCSWISSVEMCSFSGAAISNTTRCSEWKPLHACLWDQRRRKDKKTTKISSTMLSTCLYWLQSQAVNVNPCCFYSSSNFFSNFSLPSSTENVIDFSALTPGHKRPEIIWILKDPLFTLSHGIAQKIFLTESQRSSAYTDNNSFEPVPVCC